MSCKDSCVCRRRFKSRTVARMVYAAGLTAGLNPQNSTLSRITCRGRKQYPRKSNLTFGYWPLRLSSLQ